MKKNIIAISLALLSVFAWSCDDFLDINQDPNVLGDIPDAKVVLPAAEIGLANQLMGWDFGFGGGYWAQYWTQAYAASQFKFLCEYTETDFEDAYEELTSGVLNDLKRIETVSAESTNKGNYYVAEALSIFTWQIMTDVWGDIPYFEALKGDEGLYSPKFDAGADIYADLFARIDALLAIDLSGSSLDKNYDMIFGGDLAKWETFAKSVKLKLMMRLSETAGYDNAAVITFIEANNLISESAKISGSTWSDNQEGKRHPMREFEAGGAEYLSKNVIASKTFLDYLINNNDPRLDVLFSKTGSNHEGAFFGDFNSKSDTDGDGVADDKEDYSTPLFAADMDLVIMSTWEVNFFIAEAYARAGNNSKAKEYYDLGVQASLSQNGISSNDIIETGYATWIDGTIEEGIKQIAMQKWVANANYQHIESFLERNRTKYPAVNSMDISFDRENAFQTFPIGFLSVSVTGKAKTNGRLPSSPTYPESVMVRNENKPSQKADLLEKVWWDKKAGL
ncbi:MAG: SusD/RagB family nutrient-binding outer membrane lipoprotein [Marinifilaceae bacterium]|nr:SusD/RagB family nutrient-binding outer membrane lipoprotein [Marinifilaceae bacterium]